MVGEFRFQVEDAIYGRASALAKFRRRRPFAKFGEQIGFELLMLLANPLLVVVSQAHGFLDSSIGLVV